MIHHSILETELIKLRALEPSDIDLLYAWENRTDIWLVSSTVTPFSKDVLQQYISQSYLDIYTVKQLRLMIFVKDISCTVGMIDLFDFDPQNKRCGVGVFVAPQYEGNGYASEALICVQKYARSVLLLNQLYAEISETNHKSIRLFEQQGFVCSGIKKSWIRSVDGYLNQLFYQYVL
ncbi:MAG: GNAT family N-acetyltransferase [Bacteroidales bacterium]